MMPPVEVIPPAEPATPPPSPCDRCGSFAPLTQVADRRLCQACVDRRSLRIDETPLTAGVLLADSFRVIARLHWRILVVVWLVSVPFGVVHVAGLVPEWTYSLWFVFEVLADVAILQMTCAVVAGRSPSVPAGLLLAARRWPIVVVTLILVLLLTFIGFLALIVPGVIVSLGLALAWALTAIDGLGPIESMKRSWSLMDGYKAQFFGASLVINIGCFAADALVRVVDTALWSLPMWREMTDSSYTVVSVAVSFFVTVFVYSLVWIPQQVMLAALYVKVVARRRYIDSLSEGEEVAYPAQ